jgi:lysophospholipase L1-like esterase
MQIPLLFRRVLTSIVCVLCLSLLLTPAVQANMPSSRNSLQLVGPKTHYLALGDSLAFGYQPDLDFIHGYVNDFSADLRKHGLQETANLACPGETSISMMKGQCIYPYLRKFPYLGDQLDAALRYLLLHRGQVSPVTLDIGANDILPDINITTCSINVGKYKSDLATLDLNLTQAILPRLRDALTINGVVTGDLVVMNYYNPYQNLCPNTVPYLQQLNEHIAADIQGYAILADVYSAFGGSQVPNPNICNYTWICNVVFHDIHSKTAGYSVIAGAFERATGY